MNLQVHAIKATLQLANLHTNPVTLHPCESLEHLNQFRCIPHNIFITYTSFYVFLEKHLTFSTETHSNVISPTKSEKKKHGNQKVKLLGFLMSFSRTREMTGLI